MQQNYTPKNAKIHMELNEQESKIEIDGELQRFSISICYVIR